METQKMCLTLNGLCASTCACGQTGETSAADRPRVLRKRLDKAGVYDFLEIYTR